MRVAEAVQRLALLPAVADRASQDDSLLAVVEGAVRLAEPCVGPADGVECPGLSAAMPGRPVDLQGYRGELPGVRVELGRGLLCRSPNPSTSTHTMVRCIAGCDRLLGTIHAAHWPDRRAVLLRTDFLSPRSVARESGRIRLGTIPIRPARHRLTRTLGAPAGAVGQGGTMPAPGAGFSGSLLVARRRARRRRRSRFG
jgi:hypothetical protein